MLNAPPVTMGSVLVIGTIFLALWLGPELWSHVALHFLSVVPSRIAAILADPVRIETLPVAASLVTHALIHVEPVHFLMNAGFLLAFGSVCERLFGPPRFLLLLAASAAGGAVVQIAADWGERVLMHGASGAVSGCMGGVVAILLADPRQQRRRFALSFVAVMFVLNLVFGLFGPALFEVNAQVAWQAHIGGFVVGWALARGWVRRPWLPQDAR